MNARTRDTLIELIRALVVATCSCSARADPETFGNPGSHGTQCAARRLIPAASRAERALVADETIL